MGVRRSFLAVILVALLLAAGCSAPQSATTDGPSVPADLTALVGSEWTLSSLRAEGKEVAVASEARPTFAVDETGRVNGLATLNRYFGQLELRPGGELGWAGPLGSTMMAGPEHLMDQEVRFLQTLQGVRMASLRGGVLVLQDDIGQNVMEFNR
jgi:heat shock protein HslJ